MSSQAVDYDAIEATTSIEEITVDEISRDTLRSLKNDELPSLWICAPGLVTDDGEYELRSSEELGWLGHFVKKGTRLEKFGICGFEIFHNCSEQSLGRFFGDLRQCNHIKKMQFVGADLAKIIYKLGPAMISNNITHLDVEECYLDVPGAIFLFHTLRYMNSLEELCIISEPNDVFNDDEPNDALNDDGRMAEYIPSLATCTGMRKLYLIGLNLSTNSCAALGAIFPRWSALLELNLYGNSIDDDCARVLVSGLAECKQILSLNLNRNRISDVGLDVLIQGLPASVDKLNLAENEVTLARQTELLRFKKLDFTGNALCLDGTRVIAASLANPECRLEELQLTRCNIGNEGAATLADGLRDNQRLTRMSLANNSLANNNITKEGWNAFSSILCDTSSINATHGSNHTLQSMGADYGAIIPQDVEMLLELNSDEDKGRVAANKILQVHRHLDMRPFFSSELYLLPRVVAWLERFAESRPDLKLSSIFEFVRAMPMKVTYRLCKDMDKSKGEKRNLNN